MHRISRRALLQAVLAQSAMTGFVHGQTRVAGKPKPLPAGAVTHDWASFLGPTHNAVSTQTKLSRTLPPPLVFDLASGKVVSKRDIRAEYTVPQDFFGTASTPLIEGKLLIVNVGAPGGPCVVGLDKATRKEVWRAGKEWGWVDVHRPGRWQGELLVPLAQPQLRVGERVVCYDLRA